MILHRLIKDGKVAGYEKHEGGKIYHRNLIEQLSRSYTWIKRDGCWRLDSESIEKYLSDYSLAKTEPEIISEKNNIIDKRKSTLDIRVPDWKDILSVDCSFNYGCLGEHQYYIPHDRKDRYTGIDIDGEKVFERDKLKKGHCDYIVMMQRGTFGMHTRHYGWCLLADMKHCKIIGIEGVTDDKT